MITVAAARDAFGQFDFKAPTGEVERMDAVIAELAGAPVPKPVPVVMDEIVHVRLFGSGTFPERIVEPLRNGNFLAVADGGAVVGVPTAGESGLADFATFESINGFNHPRPTAALIAHLHNAFVFARGFDDQFAFVKILAARLFDIDVFSCGAGEDGGGCMPVVGSRD